VPAGKDRAVNLCSKQGFHMGEIDIFRLCGI